MAKKYLLLDPATMEPIILTIIGILVLVGFLLFSSIVTIRSPELVTSFFVLVLTIATLVNVIFLNRIYENFTKKR